MTARDASTLRHVSLAALLGIDARVLLTTDDPAVHLVYDKLVEHGIKFSDVRGTNEAREHAYEHIRTLAEAWKPKGRS
jgi:hypothetical protein